MDLHTMLLDVLPNVLKDIGLSYMSIPELIERGVALTPNRLRSIVIDTIGEKFLTASVDELNGVHVFSVETRVNGLLALLFLHRLPLMSISCDLFDSIIRYVSEQSLIAKQVIYPFITPLILLDDDEYEYRGTLGWYESSVRLDKSVLPLLYSLLGSEFLHQLDSEKILVHNPQFILSHLTEIPVTVDLIFGAIDSRDEEITQILLQLYTTPENETLLDDFNQELPTQMEFEEIGAHLKANMPRLYEMFKRSWKLQHD